MRHPALFIRNIGQDPAELNFCGVCIPSALYGMQMQIARTAEHRLSLPNACAKVGHLDSTMP